MSALIGLEKDEKQGNPDPGLQYLREINLTAEEEANYTSQCRGWVPEIVALESSDEGWRAGTSMFGVKVWSKPNADADSSRVICRGQIHLTPDVTYEQLKSQFVKVYNKSDVLAQEMRISDPMSRETKILCQMPCADDEFIRIVWGSFRAAGITWARDFCMVQHACATTDSSTGERLYVVVSGSIERPEVPDMQKLCKRIRATNKCTGFVFREPKDGGPIRITYVVNVNPNGWIPHKIVNIVCNSQATNVFRIKNKFCDTAQALAALKLEPPINSKVVGWRQAHEMSISRPAAGAAASSATVKFLSMVKVSFRVRGTAATTDWELEEASSGVGEGAWVTYPAQCPVTLTFKIQPTAAAAAAAPSAEGGAGSSDAVVLEWKGAGWFKGFVLYHRVEVA